MKTIERPLKELVKGAGIYLAGLIISKLFTYFYRLMIARTGTEQYGILSLGLSFIGFLAIFATLGMNNGVLRYVSYYRGKEDDSHIRGVVLFASRVTLFLGLLIAFLFFVFSGWISQTFFPHIDYDKLSLIFKLVALVIPLAALNFIFYAAFEAFQKLQYEVYTRNIIETSSKLILSAVLIYLGVSVIGLTVAYVFAVFLAFIFTLYFLEKKVYPIFRGKVVPLYINKELLSYSWPLVLSSFFIIILGSIDTWMLGYFKNASDVGVYNAAYPTAQLILLIPYAFLALFLPILTELYARGEKSSFESICQITTKWIFILTLLPLSLILFFSKDFLGVFFGQVYSAGYLALIMLSIGFFVYSAAMAFQNILMVVGKTKLIFFNYLVVTVFAAILNIFLIPRYGVNGAAFVTSLSYILLSILILVESYRFAHVKFFKLHYFLKSLVGSGVAILVTFLVLNFFVNTVSIYIIVILSLVASLLYLLFLFFTKAFSKEDLMIVDAIQKKFGYNLLGRIKFFRRFLEP